MHVRMTHHEGYQCSKSVQLWHAKIQGMECTIKLLKRLGWSYPIVLKKYVVKTLNHNNRSLGKHLVDLKIKLDLHTIYLENPDFKQLFKLNSFRVIIPFAHSMNRTRGHICQSCAAFTLQDLKPLRGCSHRLCADHLCLKRENVPPLLKGKNCAYNSHIRHQANKHSVAS